MVLGLTLGLAGVGHAADAPAVPAPPAAGAVWANFESTLSSGGKQIRPFAFDGDPNTYFESSQDARAGDEFTMVFDSPINVDSVSVVTGRPDGINRLDAGEVQFSTDGANFQDVARVKNGTAEVRGRGRQIAARFWEWFHRKHAAAEVRGRQVAAIRLLVTADLKHPLAIREITLASDPAVIVYRYPVEYTIDVTDAPEMKQWAEKAVQACVRAYPMINAEINSDGYRPATQVSLTLKNDYDGVAATGGAHIEGSVKYFKAHPADIGALVHETVHVAQAYRGRRNPGWLVEGIADYVRWVKWEPAGKLRRANPTRAHYNGSYQTTAQFLAYVVNKYDRDLVNELSQAMRKGQYREALFQQYTGKTVRDLDTEWRATLSR